MSSSCTFWRCCEYGEGDELSCTFWRCCEYGEGDELSCTVWRCYEDGEGDGVTLRRYDSDVVVHRAPGRGDR